MLQPHVSQAAEPMPTPRQPLCIPVEPPLCSFRYHSLQPHATTQVRRFTWAFRAAAVVGGPILVGSFVLLLAVYCARQSDKAHLKGVVGNLAEVSSSGSGGNLATSCYILPTYHYYILPSYQLN